MKPMKTKQAALQAARKDMGPEAIEGTDFNVKNTGAGYVYEEIAQTAPKAGITADDRAAHLAEGKVQAKDVGGNEVWTLPSDPFLVNGILYPNKTRAAEAKRLSDDREAATKSATPLAATAEVAEASVANKRAARKDAEAPKKARKPMQVAASDPAVRGPSKTDLIIGMLKAPGGATSKAMEDAAGWQPHSVRGLLGTLRGKGTAIISTKEKGQPTVYSIVTADEAVI